MKNIVEFSAPGNEGCLDCQVEDEAIKKQKAKMMSFLKKEGFLIIDGDEYHVDMKKLDDNEFKKTLWKLYLGRDDSQKIIQGGILKIKELVGDLIVTDNSDQNSDTTIKLEKLLDEKYKKETPKEKVINMLKEVGVVEEIDGVIIVDMKRLQDGEFGTKKEGDIFRTKKSRVKFTPANIYKLLGDTEVISKSDYNTAIQKGVIPKSKKLFNIPENTEEAFDINNIKEKDYYLDAWEMYQNVPWKNLDITTKSGDKINAREMYLAVKIFRDLHGQRGDDGVLRIFDDKKGEFVKISSQKLVDDKIKGSFKSVRTVLAESCPNLLANGAVKFDDFEIITNSESGSIFRKEFASINSERPFTAMINTVNYYIGRKFFIHEEEKIPIENIKVAPLSESTGGIIRLYEGREELIYTFKLLNDEEKQEKRDKIEQKHGKGNLTENQISARVSVGKKELTPLIKKYSPTEIVPKREGENAEEYANRIARLPDYGYVQGVTKRFSEKIGVGIHNLDWRDQLQIATMEYESGVLSRSNKLNQFADKYKLNGLRTFLSLEQDVKMGGRILSIGEKLDQKSADTVFKKYSELVDAANNIENYLMEEFGESNPNRVRNIVESMLLKGKAVLVMFANEENIKPEQVIKRLENIVINTDIFGLLLQEMKNDGGGEHLEIIEKLDISSVYNLDEETIHKVVGMAQNSWKQNVSENGVEQDFADIVTEGLRKDLLNQGGNTETYIIKYKDDPIGMIRFKTVNENILEIQSVNVHSKLKGVDIGKTLFRIIEKKAKEKTLQLNVLLKNQVSCHYIGQLGFQGYGYNDNMYGTGEPNIYAILQKGQFELSSEKVIEKQEGDIKGEFNINTPKGLSDFRLLLNKYLLKVDNQGNVIDGQSYEDKYTIIEQVSIKQEEGDIRRVVLRKNSALN